VDSEVRLSERWFSVGSYRLWVSGGERLVIRDTRDTFSMGAVSVWACTALLPPGYRPIRP
jgi:hypothetical protein